MHVLKSYMYTLLLYFLPDKRQRQCHFLINKKHRWNGMFKHSMFSMATSPFPHLQCTCTMYMYLGWQAPSSLIRGLIIADLQWLHAMNHERLTLSRWLANPTSNQKWGTWKLFVQCWIKYSFSWNQTFSRSQYHEN